ncbi:MAG: hypothetical protein M3131_02375 [Actinomycetota bacterium]|nr:hypothetical protein [Actinomycetota bacterium]
MKRLLAHRPSPALVIACIALFVSLGGVSYGLATGIVDTRAIRNNTIRTQDLRNNDIRAIDIRNSTIRGRDVALNTLTGTDIAEAKLRQVPSAATADNASALGGIGVAGFVRANDSAFTPLPLSPGWATIPGETAPGFYVDGLGFVHLHGALRRTAGDPVGLTLPANARPTAVKRFPAYSENNASVPVVAGVTVEPDGDVRPAGASLDSLVSLEGLTFRVGD